MPEEITTGELREEAGAEQRAIRCPGCLGAVFEVLLSPEQVEEERRWLQVFYSVRNRAEGVDKDHVEFTQAEATHVVRCISCGTVMRNPQPTPEALNRRYRFDSYGKDTLTELLESEREFFSQKAAALHDVLPARAKVVEIGSFVGAFLDACVQNAWDAAGVDIGEETVAFCRERGLTVEKSQLSQVAKPKSLDAIFIWNTFDQVADPGQLLEQASAALKPQGLLVLRIPNGEFKVACTELEKSARWRERALTAEAYNNFLTFPYLAGYSAGALGQLLHRHGFELQQINGDTILPLATKDTRAFAVEEEKRYKRAVARMAKRLLSDSGRNVFPWLDVYAHPFS